MGQRISFNINAELYENRFGDLAIRFPGEKVYRDVGPETGTSFVEDAREALVQGVHPNGWHEMPAHELLYGHGWHCMSRMGCVGGDVNRPGIEFEVDPGTLGTKAQLYLREVLH